MLFDPPAFTYINILIRQGQLNQIDHVFIGPVVLRYQVLDT
jgi:hypothetical protein